MNVEQMRWYFACLSSIRTLMSRILFVSHDVNLRAVASRVLTRAGFYVSTVAHAGHASLACVDGPGYDVVIIENELLEGSGAAVATRLRRYCPKLQLVRLCQPGSPIAGDGIAVLRPMKADDLVDAALRAASMIPAA